MTVSIRCRRGLAEAGLISLREGDSYEVIRYESYENGDILTVQGCWKPVLLSVGGRGFWPSDFHFEPFDPLEIQRHLMVWDVMGS